MMTTEKFSITKMRRKFMSTYQDVCQDTLLLLPDPLFSLAMSERNLLGRYLKDTTMLMSSAPALMTTSQVTPAPCTTVSSSPPPSDADTVPRKVRCFHVLNPNFVDKISRCIYRS